MCMSSKYIFLTMVIPSPSNPKRLIIVYLEQLIKELQNLWHIGVLTRDSVKNETFPMRAALMWTVNDLPAYGMAFGCSSAGIIGCQVCMEDKGRLHSQDWRENRFANGLKSIVLRLKYRYHTRTGINGQRKSIFWELEYWLTHLIRHNLDVMYIEKNVFENIFNTVMDIKEKMKDTLNARKDLKEKVHPD
ncbi:UNVERIFIED_CONTAM: hypothetical protein Sindi_1652900 [Sesamum indicum]